LVKTPLPRRCGASPLENGRASIFIIFYDKRGENKIIMLK